jgi:hypothetical protein
VRSAGGGGKGVFFNVADPDPSSPYFLGLLDPDPVSLVRCTDPVLLSSSKNSIKKLIPTV